MPLISLKKISQYKKMITDFSVPQISHKDLLDELKPKFAPSNKISSLINQEQVKNS